MSAASPCPRTSDVGGVWEFVDGLHLVWVDVDVLSIDDIAKKFLGEFTLLILTLNEKCKFSEKFLGLLSNLKYDLPMSVKILKLHMELT